MKLPPTLHNKIVEFLSSLPNIHNTNMRQALIESAGFDLRLHEQLDVSGAPASFFPTLVPALIRYGRLEDGRHPLEALLEAAKNYVGGEKRIYCDRLIEEFRLHLPTPPNPSQEGNASPDTAQEGHWAEKTGDEGRLRWIFSCREADKELRYFIEIEDHKGRFVGRIHQGDPQKCCRLPDMKLGPEDRISIKGRPVALKELMRAQIDPDRQRSQAWADERGQYEIGVYLYRQLFGALNPADIQPKNGEVDLRIITQDEHIARLPWMLLAHQGMFLNTTGWSLSLSDTYTPGDCELPPSPKMLIIAPQPTGSPSSGADAHMEALEELLSSADAGFTRGSNLQVAADWEVCKESLSAFEPDVIYFYGFGSGTHYTPSLIFEGKNNDPVAIPVADLLSLLRNMTKGAALLVYINYCGGEAEGFLGAGKLMATLIPAVVTTRRIATVPAAQAQGLAFWENVLLEGMPPHKTIAHIRRRLSESGVSPGDTRWITPLLHGHYDRWKSYPPKPPNRLERDPHWRVKLDRVRQFSQVFFETYQMLMERRPRGLGYLWYGAKDQGLELFHNRLKVELQEKLIGAILYEVKPEWPTDMEDPDRSFRDMLKQAFGISTLEHLGGRIRTHTRSVSGRQTLVYIRHRPVASAYTFDPKYIRTYLQWFNINVVAKLPEQTYTLLGISYEVKNPAEFRKLLIEKERLNDPELSGMVFQLLDELERVYKKHLLDFLQTHNIQLPADLKDGILDEILHTTKGVYEKVLDELKELERRAWRRRKEAEKEEQEKHGEEDAYKDVI